jgi:hypothetical protein
MRHAIGLLGSAVLGLGGATALESNARAQESYAHESYFRSPVPAPSRTVEVQLSGGYTQGFGNIFPSHAINDVAGGGIGITAALGYRYSPLVSFEVEGQYQAYTAGNFGTSQGLDTNIGVTLHATPHRRGDPWLRLATGYRWVWLSNATPGPFAIDTVSGDIGFSGWDVINARIGYDVRSSGRVAWAPVVGANLQTFVWANSTPLTTVQWGTFIYAGLQARFDASAGATDRASARSGLSAE